MTALMTMDIHFDDVNDAESALGILKFFYDQGREEASLAASWRDAYNSGFTAALQAFQQLAMSCLQTQAN